MYLILCRDAVWELEYKQNYCLQWQDLWWRCKIQILQRRIVETCICVITPYYMCNRQPPALVVWGIQLFGVKKLAQMIAEGPFQPLDCWFIAVKMHPYPKATFCLSMFCHSRMKMIQIVLFAFQVNMGKCNLTTPHYLNC